MFTEAIYLIVVHQMSALFGDFFIGIFLSIIFMVGTVLVIYYKQISEAMKIVNALYHFAKVGLDQKQIKSKPSINRS